MSMAADFENFVKVLESICRYEETVERVIELESHGDGSMAKVVSLEAELRRTKDKFIECLVSENL